MKHEDIFRIDHGKQLSQAILFINRKRLDEFMRAAKDDQVEPGCVSMKMIDIQQTWMQDIDAVCRELISLMSDQVNEFRRIATETLNGKL